MRRKPVPPPSQTPFAVSQQALRVLLIDDGARSVSLIRDELTRQGHVVVGVIDCALAVHDRVRTLAPDVVIVDAESPSRDTLENLAVMSATHPRPVVVFAEDAAEGPMQHALAAGVSAYVIAGLSAERLVPVLQVAIARFAQERSLREQLGQARAKLGERKVVEQAKAVLMRQAGLSEDDAHHHLRRLAMDNGQRLARVAERVLQAHELLRPRS
jgi:response regulator NasT